MEPTDEGRETPRTSVEIADLLDQMPSPTPELASRKARDMAWLRRVWPEFREQKYNPLETAQLACIMISQSIVDCESQVGVLDLCEKLHMLIQQAVNMGTGLYTKVRKDAPRIAVPSRYN